MGELANDEPKHGVIPNEIKFLLGLINFINFVNFKPNT
ncbi:MAG: hypothetical protein RL266_623 [Bacteroidota bacterium]|jgi:hypothetical protein